MGLRRGGGPWAAAAVMAVACVVAVVGAAGAAERGVQAADATVKAAASNTWDQTSVSVATGEKVTWDLDGGNGVTHNVHGDTGPPQDPGWTQFTSPFGSSGQYSYTFTQPGTYHFICQAHPQTMTGTVTVTGSATTPTPTSTATGTATPTVTVTTSPATTPSTSPGRTPTPVPPARAAATPDHTTPAPGGSASADRTPPTLAKLKLRAITHGARVSFTVSESS